MDFLRQMKVLPRWVIASLDAVILFQSAFFAYLLRFNFELEIVQQNNAFFGSLCFMLSGILVMFFTKSYKGIVRHTGFKDSMIIFRTILLNFVLISIVNIVFDKWVLGGYLLPVSVLIIAVLSSLFLLVFYRLLVKELFLYLKSGFVTNQVKVGVIFGASEAGIIANDVIKRESNSNLVIAAFLDDDPKKEGKIIEGKKILKGLENLSMLVENQGVSELIIAVRDLPLKRKKQIIEECFKYKVHVSIVPPLNQWINRGLNSEAIRDLKIEDLLGREQISLDNPQIKESLREKIVLVTGAAGSIGSELCRQIMYYNPRLVVLLDMSESALYELDLDLKNLAMVTPHQVVLADIRDENSMKSIFSKFKPDIVFHAAAYKHVPMIENYPEEAIKSNILGTKILADLSVLHHVDKFVFVSTDKAVNPTNVMGATKRAAEMYVQSLNAFLMKHHKNSYTRFITTRFGNVLGSNGSVVPLFKKQIQRGGPITVTHPDVTRYFMTVPEASQLVIEAGIMGNGGEIFAFDMGEPIKILDLATNMIQLSGKKVGDEIKIVFTGLRDGEKLYEELLNDSEKVKITHHPKIKIAQVSHVHYYKIESQLELFFSMVGKSNENEIVFHLKSIIPEFKSNVSSFEVLDRLN
ncbi:NDP-sugar epimerase, includes UDP-GlcNAc-inverting 4,6-dehydratase FlaA1 and capsular polysaccharide biosynthesis protein EpsC [Aquiflexum balticum DSM 16537]|uniref:NDP-sugar epimerase, includes UDP-GlcNAc-inverting 4,6-dehydratase FlaA1 and capsular polysaccharide biosynthesis protein EpsC n=1 Tax=Aquiflexum balticum DSM 16537 TaxID=758820 RepID=A0A1W2H6R2_9BACT|nr:nucleoside-diphosphate sugar epimerase/dehydratase [Aquiflexum balticum]SMD44637.1 NDP-sugar epimerase, includes UDP-GlcNAc-inverting 4,6-dehydratase FlaA1 and capsular polysaccharide biosynthesis protein EpsC [Aquiflexum balticum DSM 16537]